MGIIYEFIIYNLLAYIFIITLLLFHITLGVAIHEYLHCSVDFIASDDDMCTVVFFNPTHGGELLGSAYTEQENLKYHKYDHYWIYPLEILMGLWLSYRVTRPLGKVLLK